MDYIKNVVGVLLALMLVTTVSGEDEEVPFWVDVGENQDDLNVELLPFSVFSVNTTENVTYEFNFRTFNAGLYSNTVYVKVFDDNGVRSADAELVIECASGNDYSLLLNTYSNWVDEGWAIQAIQLNVGDTNQVITSQNDEEEFIGYSNNCEITLNDENATLAFYYPLWGVTCELAIATQDRFDVPNDALGNITAGVNNITQSAFALMEIILVITAVVALIFVIIFIWIVIEYMANRVSKTNREL